MIERVTAEAMAEDVQEELAFRRQPGADTPEQFAPVHHVLEHLDRNDAVEQRRRLECVHARLDDEKAGKSGLRGFLFDVHALGLRIGHCRHRRMRELPCDLKLQRPPAAAEFQNGVSVD